ncbi:MAG: DUF1800 domain-containing protein, partial [Anaerolineales bacterium]|nr:DUF1800 domain-containing protein [Anaerolineales bacterium]
SNAPRIHRQAPCASSTPKPTPPPLLTYLAEMGQPSSSGPPPMGFPDRAEAWNGSLLTRWRLALALVNDGLEGTVIDWTSLENTAGERGSGGAEGKKRYLQQFAGLLLGQALPEPVAAELLQASSDEKILVATLLGSPAFQWK